MESAGHLFNSCKNDTKAYIGGNYGPIHLAIVIIKKDLLDLGKCNSEFFVHIAIVLNTKTLQIRFKVGSR